MKAGAQSVTVSSRSFMETTFRGRIVDSLTSEALPSAVISVVSKTVSGNLKVRNHVADQKGSFSFVCSGYEQHRMEVAVLGYKPHTVYLSTDEAEVNLGLVRLTQSTQAIDDVVVKARIQMYKMKGDTIIYQPRAVKTMTDDPMLEILRHMPGVEVDEGGGIKILGQQVERTYVNQKLLFGDDPTVALRQLDAKEVASIMAYDEVDEADAVSNGENARKRKVINIVTFKDFVQSQTAKARAEAGADFHADADGERPMRYLGSAEIGFYSETLQLSASGQSNNLIAPKGEFPPLQKSLRQSNAKVAVSGKSGGAHKYNVGYNYHGSVEERLSASSRDYFPTEYFTSQYIADSTRRKSESSTHSLSGGYTYSSEKSRFSTSLNAGLSDGSSLDEQLQSTLRDGALASANDMLENSLRDSRYLRWSANGSRQFRNGNSLNANVTANLRGGRSRGLRLERRTLNGRDSVLDQEMYAPAPDNSADADVSYGLNFGKAGRLSFRSGVKYAGRAERRLYTDRLTGVQDWARSEDAFDKVLTWKAGTTYSFSRGASTLDARLDYNLESRTYEDYKTATTERRNFHLVNGTLSYLYYKPKRNISVSFNSNYTPVQAKDFSSRINDSNPLYVSTGNASLVPTRNYVLWLNGDFLAKKSSFGLSAWLTLVTDPILRRSVFFKEATTLPGYNNYVMPAGSTLSTLENGASHFQFLVTGKYKTRISPLRLLFDAEVMYLFSNPEEKLYDRTDRTHRHRTELKTSFTTNFSSQFRLKLQNTVGVEFQNRFGNSSREFRDLLMANVQWDILHNLFLSADYTAVFQSSSSPYTTPTTHLLNLSLGCRVLKERGRVAVNAYDVLNDYSPIRIAQSVQYISTSVSYVGANYFTVSFEYKFNNRREAK